jgi:hypothetical protein
MSNEGIIKSTFNNKFLIGILTIFTFSSSILSILTYIKFLSTENDINIINEKINKLVSSSGLIKSSSIEFEAGSITSDSIVSLSTDKLTGDITFNKITNVIITNEMLALDTFVNLVDLTKSNVSINMLDDDLKDLILGKINISRIPILEISSDQITSINSEKINGVLSLENIPVVPIDQVNYTSILLQDHQISWLNANKIMGVLEPDQLPIIAIDQINYTQINIEDSQILNISSTKISDLISPDKLMMIPMTSVYMDYPEIMNQSDIIKQQTFMHNSMHSNSMINAGKTKIKLNISECDYLVHNDTLNELSILANGIYFMSLHISLRCDNQANVHLILNKNDQPIVKTMSSICSGTKFAAPRLEILLFLSKEDKISIEISTNIDIIIGTDDVDVEHLIIFKL